MRSCTLISDDPSAVLNREEPIHPGSGLRGRVWMFNYTDEKTPQRHLLTIIVTCRGKIEVSHLAAV